jgi:general secretion pathway protein D
VNRLISRMAITAASALLVAGCASSRLHQQGVDAMEQGQYEIALQKLGAAASSDPSNLAYRLDLKSRHEEAVLKLIGEGDRARAAGQADVAEAAYKRVQAIESGNDRARRGLEGVEADRRHAQLIAQAQQELKNNDYEQADARVRSVLAEDPGYAPATALRAKIDASRGPVTVTPRLHTRDNRPVTLQFRDAATKMVFEVLSRQTGINFIFDKDVKSDSKTTIYVQDVPIDQAIDLVIGQNQLARQVLSDNMVLIYPNTAAKQKDYQDQIVKTFYLNTASPKDVEGLIKTVLDAKTLVINERAGAIVMRDTPENVRMAEKLVASVDLAEPEVMMEVEVLEISRKKLEQLGISYPANASLAITPVSGGKGLVLSDLHKQNSSTITVSNLGIGLDALKQASVGTVLASPRIRARNKEKAKVLIGSREPVVSVASSSGVGGIATNASVQYLDVGLTLDVEPTIYADSDVAIKVNLEVSSITNVIKVPTGNGGETRAYEIGTRSATTLLQLRDGETQILGGLIQDSDTRSASKIPGFGDIPLLGRLFSDHSTDKERTEVVLSITPRIIRAKPRPSSDTTEFWFGTESRSGLSPLGAPSGPATRATGGAPTTGAAAPMVPAGATGTVRPATDVNSVDGTTSGSAAVSAALVSATPVSVGPAGGGAMPARLAALNGITAVPSAKVESDGPTPHPVATMIGPAEVKVGDEFTVTLQMQTDVGIGHVRAQARFDSAALQLIGGDAGSMVPAAVGAKVSGRSGGAQLDVVAPTDQPLTGTGDLMVLKFKALQARAQTAVAAQLSIQGGSGASLASNTPAPLTLSITN